MDIPLTVNELCDPCDIRKLNPQSREICMRKMGNIAAELPENGSINDAVELVGSSYVVEGSYVVQCLKNCPLVRV